MTTPFAPLSEDEFDELDQFLLYDVDTEDVMTLDMVDGFLHAIAVGPTTLHPKQWLPKIWGTKEMVNYTRDHTVADSLRYMAGWQAGMFMGDDMAEEFVAKSERRDPNFEGLPPRPEPW